MRTLTTVIAFALAAGCGVAGARADAAKFDAAMQPLLAQYLKIHAALASDTLKGVPQAAQKIALQAARLDPRAISGAHAAHYGALPQKIRDAALAVLKAPDLAACREAFKRLSQPMAMWATLSKPAGVNVVFCSMAPGSWLQQEKTIANPYYGASMLRCGEIVEGADKGVAGGHMKPGQGPGAHGGR